jgi:hypothetical protein
MVVAVGMGNAAVPKSGALTGVGAPSDEQADRKIAKMTKINDKRRIIPLP